MCADSEKRKLTEGGWRMITIQKNRVADCDRSTSADGKRFTSSAWEYVVCEDNDINSAYETFDNMADAEKKVKELTAEGK
jgi:ribosomal protein L37AE/L43A